MFFLEAKTSSSCNDDKFFQEVSHQEQTTELEL